ncbi:uncharacterized protein [Drosophila virilis]|uniref:Uncharacterized protein n=1 Tax=Drosophila virilis TaxID=7244 RepID=A0A0Q9W9L6_DROVI|nr:uncharacterized protein LOC26531829 [Drosophila virilis]KRF81370.1 uncharacterized protein Dvir_GJ27059 [Drosophila virilis]
MDNTLDNQLVNEAVDMMSNLKIIAEPGEPNELSIHKKPKDYITGDEIYQNLDVSMPDVTPLTDSFALGSAGDSEIKVKAVNRRLSLHTLAQVVLMLQKRLNHAKSMADYVDVTDDVVYWRALAMSRGQEIERFLNVIELQKKRIDTLERDLGTLVNLAQETQKMLADISPEKPSSDKPRN